VFLSHYEWKEQMSIANWLHELGLTQYAATFEKEAIDLEMLPDLDESDLIAIGLPLGHRKRILRAISAEVEPVSERAGEAERRRITVLFCDLAGSTALSERLDPEDLRDLLQAYQEACVAPVEGLGGHVAKYIGDGLLAYFGYPHAHEDDAARAVNAALEMMDAIHRINGLGETTLEAHIGIHSGLVVAGEMGAGATREVQAIVGETPNIAARLETLAAPGEVLISDATRRLVEGLFVCDALGPKSLKGVEAPIQVHRVRARTGARNRFDVAQQRGLAPMVGRDQEIALLLARWERACLSEGQVFLLCGEAGIGKSRIVQQLCESVGRTGGTEIILQCSAYHVNSALYPFVEEIERSAGFETGDDANTRSKKLTAMLHGAVSVGGARRISALLSLSSAEDDKEDAETRKRRTFDAVVERLESLMAEAPVCLIFEDAHWADPSSTEMLDRIVNLAQTTRILAVITFRPEFDAPWLGRPHATLLALNRLGREQSHQIVTAHARELGGAPDLAERIVERAEGVPLFLEELTRTVLEAGDAAAEENIPSTLDASLMARLDQLGPAKEVAQTGSVIGREFSVGLLAEALNKPVSALASPLARIVASGLVYPRGSANEPVYVFKHALVQDAAYGSLLRASRQRLHGRVADVLRRDIELSAPRFETLAYHLSAADRPEEAAEMWLCAGREAQRRSADKEAIAHFRAGLCALRDLPESPERDAQELVFQLALSPRLLATEGWGAPETAESYARARELCGVTDRRDALPPVLYGEYLIFVAKANYEAAYARATELLALAEELEDEAGSIQGHRVIGWCSLYLGVLAHAEEHAERVLQLYDADRHGSVALGYGYDPQVSGLSIRAITRSIRGDDAAASEAAGESIRHAREIRHVGSLGYALMFSGAMPAAMRGDREAARDCARELASLAKEHDSSFWRAYSDVILGWAEDNGQDGGVVRLERGLAELATSARNPWYPLFLGLLAEVRLRSGDAAHALRILDEAACAVNDSSERYWEAEIYRLRGLALFETSPRNAVEARKWISKAVQVARDQGASALAARADNDLAALPAT
jgi:class 3 adenylate cyclase/predicted ATPase